MLTCLEHWQLVLTPQLPDSLVVQLVARPTPRLPDHSQIQRVAVELPAVGVVAAAALAVALASASALAAEGHCGQQASKGEMTKKLSEYQTFWALAA